MLTAEFTKPTAIVRTALLSEWHGTARIVVHANPDPTGADGLDQTDLEIIQGLVDGRTIEEIMPSVRLARSAVYRRIEGMRSRFGAHSIAHLAALVVDARIVVPRNSETRRRERPG